MNISPERLEQTFLKLVRVDGVSRNEKKVKEFITNDLHDYVLTIHEDNAGELINGNCGNLFMKIRGNDLSRDTIILSAHMDTIQSTKKLKPVVGNGKITSDGSTILGADNRLGVALISEVVKSLNDNNAKFGNIEILFSVSEEIGLLGIKQFDFSKVKGKYALVLDSGNMPVGVVVNKAPSALRFSAKITGQAAHAGIAPENGINAISIASRAIAKIKQGKISPSTTVNIGTINGGQATNIVPDLVSVGGEIRSYKPKDIEIQLENVKSIFSKEAANAGGLFSIDQNLDYEFFCVDPDSKIIKMAERAVNDIFDLRDSFGGSDANVFNRNGIESVILGIGSWEPHTKEEYVNIDEMSKTAQWIYDIVTS